MTPEEVAKLGYDCYVESYQGKFYPEMKQLIANLKEYGFEVWILTASPEFLYQKFLSEGGIPGKYSQDEVCRGRWGVDK